MSIRLVNIDRETPMLLPVDMRDWIRKDDLVHYIVEAVERLPLKQMHVNHRGTGSEQFPPKMLLSLLIYCYARGVFSSREIERLTVHDLRIRYICANTHPDHSTIAGFRRENREAFKETFVKVLEMAQECKMLKVGTVAVDGTKIAANASKHSAVSHKRAGEMIAVLQGEVQQLMEKAEQADSTPLKEGLTIPKEIQLREDRIKKFDAAIQVIEARAKARGQAEQVRLDAEYEAKRARRQVRREQGKAVQGREPQPKQASTAPKPKDQYNFTDAQSAMMPVAGGGFVQGYNAQVTVEVDSMLIVGQGVTTQPNDRAQLVPGIESIPASLGQPATVLVDSGYYSPAQIQQVEGGCEGQGDNAPSGDSAPSGDDAGSENNQQMASNETADCAGGQVAGADGAPATGITVLVAVNKITHGCRVADLEVKPDPEPPAKDAPLLDKMRHRINTAEGRAKYNLRKQTVEPVIGIIKSCIGFRQFSMRGQGLAESEWALVSVAWNLKRLHVLTQQAQVRLAAAQMQS